MHAKSDTLTMPVMPVMPTHGTPTCTAPRLVLVLVLQALATMDYTVATLMTPPHRVGGQESPSQTRSHSAGEPL